MYKTKNCPVTCQAERYLFDRTRIRGIKRVKFEVKKGKDKAIPLQAWTGPKGSRRWRLPDFKTIGT
jgi:hypothetical protein